MSEIPRNPYRPGAATRPVHLAGRDPQVARFRKILSGAPEIPANLRLTGLRGVGKSVLLKQLEDVAKHDNWAAVRHQLEPRHNSETELLKLIENLVEASKRRMSKIYAIRGKVSDAIEVSRSILAVKIEEATFSLAGATEEERELVDTLGSAVEVAVNCGFRGFALLLDEAQILKDDKNRDGEHPLSMLVAAVNALQEAGLSIALTLCGLPTLRANLQKARTYSERMFKAEQIGALTGNPGPASEAFTVPLNGTGISATPELVARVLKEVEGYPFFIQLWGAELWSAATEAGINTFTVELLDEIEDQIYERLDEEFYAGRIDSLTPSEQDMLLLSAECEYPPLHSAEIRNLSGKTSGNTNVLLGRLTEQGVLYRIQKGQYEYTAPKFYEYLKRRNSASATRIDHLQTARNKK